MYQADRGNYKTKESLWHSFSHSCLGRIIILVVITIILLIIARLTIPSEQKMTEEMIDDIRQCIEANDSIRGDWIDDAIHNVGYIFTSADGIEDEEIMKLFHKYNRLEYVRHTFCATEIIHNNLRPEGTRVGIGIFGLVIPTVNFNDFLLRTGTIHKGYNRNVINTYNNDFDLGTNPNLKEYHYRGEAEN